MGDSVTQPDLLADVARVERPWKRTTTTSKASLRTAEDAGLLEVRRRQVLRGLRAMWNRSQIWPTADELAQYLFTRKQLPDPHRDHVSPRLNELADGRWVTRIVDGKKVRSQVGGGAVERGEKRKSTVSGLTVLTWRAREAGSAA